MWGVSLFVRSAAFLCAIVALGYAWDRVSDARRCGKRITLSTIIKIPNNRESIAATVLIVIGAIDQLLWLTISSTTIGAFYEKPSYSETYDATLYLDEKPIFCMVDMHRSDGEYFIDTIYLPYGKVAHPLDVYYPNGKNRVHLMEGEPGEIVLERQSDDTSEARLAAEVVTAYGDYCGSREGEIYHFTGCISARNIASNNLVFFESEREALALGYAPCKRCFGY